MVWGWGVGATEIGAVGAGAGRRSRRIVDGGTGGRMDGDAGAAARRKEPPEAGPGKKSTPGVAYRGHGGRRQTQRPRAVPQGNGDRDLDAGSGRGDHASRERPSRTMSGTPCVKGCKVAALSPPVKR